jgi:hypothetical protein
MTKSINWDVIHLRYKQGESPYSITKNLGGVPSKVGIMKRAKREGWRRIDEETMRTAENLPIVRRASGSALGKRAPENIALILESIELGATEKVAAGIAGISPKTLTRWKQEDSRFAMEVYARRSQNVAEMLGHINQAAQKDWKAAAWSLERDPCSREEFGNRNKEKEMPTIILNIRRDEVVIEGQKGHDDCIEGSAKPHFEEVDAVT